MATDEVLGPRKTMFILVIVVGCFAILWPRILSPLLVGNTKQQLQPNQLDRDAGCCEVMFGSELAVLELINEVCNGNTSPTAAAECRNTVNETCGVDIAAFLKRSDNVGKTSKMLVKTMQSSNSSCLKEHFGVPMMSLGPHIAYNSWTFQDTMKQERSPIRGAGPHPALRERGRAIPVGTPPPPSKSSTIQMPPNVRVRSPLEGYYLDIKPPPIPGMRPPLGSPGGPVPAPKTSMGFVMPIYTICIIMFFVYTISKIFFKRATVPYEPVTPDPQFRRRVFRDDSRTTPDKLGHKEKDTIVSAISGLVAEVRQQMEASYVQNQQTQERQDNHTRPYTNGTVLHNSGPVHIIASEYTKEKSPEPKENSPEPKEKTPEPKETSPESKESTPDPESREAKLKSALDEVDKMVRNVVETEGIIIKEIEDYLKEKGEVTAILEKSAQIERVDGNIHEDDKDSGEIVPEKDVIPVDDKVDSPKDLTEPEFKKNGEVLSRATEDFIEEAKLDAEKTKELLKEALDEEEYEEEEEPEKSSVKVLGMEVRAESADGGTFRTEPATAQSHAHHPLPTAQPAAPRTPHEAEEVQSIFLETEIPKKSRVLVDFEEDSPDPSPPTKHSPMVVSGKMTLSLIQDAPRDTPERDAESTVDDFTTASAVTQDAAEKEGSESEEEVEEEIEIEEIEEEEVTDEEEDLPEEVIKEDANKEEVVVKPKSEE